jgi:hypothetical protein
MVYRFFFSMNFDALREEKDATSKIAAVWALSLRRLSFWQQPR